MVRGPAPRPKRGGEEFARTRYHEDGAESKKPRFDVRNPSALLPDAPEEDAVLDADEIGKRGQQAKRNAVNIDGYDSDSSNENFNARAEAKSKGSQEKNRNGPSGAEDEQDMFADEDGSAVDEEDEAVAGARKPKKKAVSFVDVDDIEGQVTGSKSGGHVSADLRGRKQQESSSDSDSDVDDTIRAEMDSTLDTEVGAGGKKKHAPKLDAFNLRAEKEDGGFDEQLNYVRKAADPDAVHDTWLQGLSKKDMKKAREAQDKRDHERRQKALEDDALVTSDILAALIPRLEPAETVLEALARLGRGKSRKEPKWKRKKQSKNAPGMDLDADSEPEDPVETQRREAVEAITEAADRLLSRGQTEVYDTERELLMRQYRRETGQDWTDPVVSPASVADSGQVWEYRWADARDGGATHGPYDASTMLAWNDAGYFGDGVEFRRPGTDGTAWTATVDFA